MFRKNESSEEIYQDSGAADYRKLLIPRPMLRKRYSEENSNTRKNNYGDGCARILHLQPFD